MEDEKLMSWPGALVDPPNALNITCTRTNSAKVSNQQDFGGSKLNFGETKKETTHTNHEDFDVYPKISNFFSTFDKRDESSSPLPSSGIPPNFRCRCFFSDGQSIAVVLPLRIDSSSSKVCSRICRTTSVQNGWPVVRNIFFFQRCKRWLCFCQSHNNGLYSTCLPNSNRPKWIL